MAPSTSSASDGDTVDLLIVNSNTSDSVTELVRREALTVAQKGTRITALTAPFGPAAIQGHEDAVIAAEATRSAIASFDQPCDGAIIACFSDPGLNLARQEAAFPVVGIAEAAMLRAVEIGERFAILTVAPSTIPEIERLAAIYEVDDCLTGVHALPRGVLQAHSDPKRTASDLAELAQKVMTSEHPDVLILGGAITAGMTLAVAPVVQVPVLDGLSCAVQRIERIAEKPRRNKPRD